MANEETLNNQSSDKVNVDEQTNINQIEISNLREDIDDKAFVQKEVTETLDRN